MSIVNLFDRLLDKIVIFKEAFIKYKHNKIKFIFLVLFKITGIDRKIENSIVKNYKFNMVKIKKEPKISVIIPTFNGEKEGLEQLIKSIYNQKYDNIEIIAVDSGSTDNTLSILKKYGCKILKIRKEDFRHDYARNLGADIASGKYLFFTVQDAKLACNNYFKKAISILEKNDNIVSFSARQKAKQNACLYAKFLSEQFATSNGYLFDYNVIGNKYFNPFLIKILRNDQLAKLIHVDDTNHLTKRDFFIENKFSVPTCEDMEYGKKILMNNKFFVYSNEVYIEHSHVYNEKNIPKYFKRVFIDMLTIYDLIGYKQSYLNIEFETMLYSLFYLMNNLSHIQINIVSNGTVNFLDIIKINQLIDEEYPILPYFLKIGRMLKIEDKKNLSEKMVKKIQKKVFFIYKYFFSKDYRFLVKNIIVKDKNTKVLNAMKNFIVFYNIKFFATYISYYCYASVYSHIKEELMLNLCIDYQKKKTEDIKRK